MDDENLFESLSRNAKFGMSKLRYVNDGYFMALWENEEELYKKTKKKETTKSNQKKKKRKKDEDYKQKKNEIKQKQLKAKKMIKMFKKTAAKQNKKIDK